MRKLVSCTLVFFGLVWIFCTGLTGQLTEKELSERAQWEDFLKNAVILEGSQPLPRNLAVSEPHRLQLENDGIKCWGWWKNVEGRPHGYPDYWQYEIAAYELDKLLSLNMIPPTVEKRYQGDRGALSLEVTGTVFRDLKQQGTSIPADPEYRLAFFRGLYLRRTWDNLIGNKDRNEGDMLYTDDWRTYLIDHSRAFNPMKKLLNSQDKRSGKEPVRALPAAFVEKLADLDFDSIKDAVGEYLKKKDIERLLIRRDMILEEVERLKKKIPDFLY